MESSSGRGRARIHIGTLDIAPDLAKEGPPGSAIIFFDTDDVDAMHAAVLSRGGQPSELEKVNWIKRCVFEIRDPDGHVVWFGQSYHQKSPDRPHRMMSRIMPELPCDDVPAAVRCPIATFSASASITSRKTSPSWIATKSACC